MNWSPSTAPISPSNEQRIGPSLGQESIKLGVEGALGGGVLVLLFMWIYYERAGTIANIAVTMNLFWQLAVLASFGASMTLPGIAGGVEGALGGGLLVLLFIAAALLFFATGLIGRAWCGYFCFQTLWSDLFILIEKTIQGERPARMRLYNQPWNAEKLLKIGGSHALMILVSFWTAVTFAAYFAYAPDFVRDLFTGHAADAGYITVIALTLTTYFAAGIIRENICTLVCPYARFQAVMYDKDTLTVSYNNIRGGETWPA